MAKQPAEDKKEDGEDGVKLFPRRLNDPDGIYSGMRKRVVIMEGAWHTPAIYEELEETRKSGKADYETTRRRRINRK